MSASLPPRPSLEWLRKTAKDRLAELRAAEPASKLADAQRAVARDYGFASWRALKAHVERAAGLPERPSDEDVISLFLRLVGTGRIDDVRAMLTAAPALVNAAGPHPFWGGRPQPLHVAIEGKRRDIVDLLLAHGADVNGTNDSYGHWSPLMLAINRKASDLRDELLRRGARVGLLEALLIGDDARVDEWLRRDGLPQVVPNDGSILAFARTPFAIDRLIALGAPMDIKDQWGTTPIEAMSRLGPEGRPLVDRLIAHGALAAPSEYARLGDIDRIARLVDDDPAIARLDAVMMAAVDFRHHRLVTWLLERGASANARTDVLSRHTALHAAAWNGDVPMVELLVRAGADLTARDEQYHATPLGWAKTSIQVSNNPLCAEVVAYLEAAGAP